MPKGAGGGYVIVYREADGTEKRHVARSAYDRDTAKLVIQRAGGTVVRTYRER